MGDTITSAQDIADACDRALALAPPTFPPTLPASPVLLGAPEWHPFETAAWPIGEQVRLALIRTPKFKRDNSVVSKVLEVATCRNLRRGRQSFVMALGFVGARHHAPSLAVYVDDPDVDGQIVDTLLKMKAAGFGEQVRPLLKAKHSWIRRLAKRYLDRYQETA